VTCRDEITWHPKIVVEKYSPAQTRWAVRRLGVSRLHGAQLHALFRAPEDGCATDEGNRLTEAGLANIAALVAGEPYARSLSLGRVCFGVGTDAATPPSGVLQHLANLTGETADTSFYLPMDTGYPELDGSVVLTGQATFQAAEANFSWREWCWATGGGKLRAGPVLGEVFSQVGSAIMMNRKVPEGGLGVKEPGGSWVFRTEINFR
jgi:hypothetical protein